MKKIIMALSIIAVFGLAGCSEKDDDVLVVLTSSGYEPYEMVDTNGDLTGFDIELMEALALEAGLTIEWKDVNFDGIVASLQAGQYEVAIAGISPTPDRDLVIDFSDVYFNSESGLINYMLFETEDAITSLDDLDGLVVGTQLGTVQAELLTDLSSEYNFTVEYRNSYTQIVEEIKVGAIDVLVTESLVADSILEVNSTFSKVELNASTDSLYGNAIAFSEGSEYVEIFNEALLTLQENGTLDELIEKWFN